MRRETDTEPLVTDEMIGYAVVFGLDIILIVGVLWIVGFVSGTVFGAVTGVIVAIYATWILWRWYTLRYSPDSGDEEDDPIETLKRRYASGELSETEFEEKLERLMDAEEREEQSVELESFDR